MFEQRWHPPRALTLPPLETPVLWFPCEERLPRALVGDHKSSSCSERDYKSWTTCQLFVLPQSSAVLQFTVFRPEILWIMWDNSCLQHQTNCRIRLVLERDFPSGSFSHVFCVKLKTIPLISYRPGMEGGGREEELQICSSYFNTTWTIAVSKSFGSFTLPVPLSPLPPPIFTRIGLPEGSSAATQQLSF